MPYPFTCAALPDPELTIGCPPPIKASTGMDALIHAISFNATDLTDILAFRAMELLYKDIVTAYANGINFQGRSHMIEGSPLAGIASCQ